MARQLYSVSSVPRLGPDYSRVFASREATEWTFGSAFSEVENPSPTIRYHSDPGEKVGDAFERMLTADATLAGLAEKRIKAVTGLPWNVIPGDESEAAKRVADATAEMLWGIEKFEANLAHQLGGIPRGCAFEEMLWEPRKTGPLAGMWVVSQLIDRPMSRFGFKEVGGQPNVLCVRRKDGKLDPVPPHRILHFCHGTKDSPWGLPLLDRVYWFQWASLHLWKYACVAAEKWAQPTVIVTYEAPGGEPDAQSPANEAIVAAAQAAAYTFQTEQSMAMPDNVDLKLMEAIRSGTVEYGSFLQLLDRAKALVFLGEVDTSGMSQGPGSFAKNRVSNEVRYETIVADACELANTISEGLVAPFVRVNFGLDAPMPYFEFDVEEASDRTLRQAGSQRIFDAGYPQPRSYWYRVNQVPEAKPGEATVRGPFVGAAPPANRFPAAAPTAAPPDAPPAPAAMAAAWSDQEFAA